LKKSKTVQMPKTFQPELTFEDPDKPLQIVTDTSAEFLALCERDRSGELVVEAVARGDGNSVWVCEVRYK